METSETVWKTVSEIANRTGVSKAAVSKRIKRFRESGDLIDGEHVRTNAKGHVASVDVARYEQLIEQTGDASKAPIPATAPQASAKVTEMPASGSLNAARLEETQIRVRKAKLEMAEMEGQLCRADLVRHHGEELAGIVLEALNGSTAHAEDLLAAYQEHGISGFNKGFKRMLLTVRTDIAARFKAYAAENMDGDPEPALDVLPMAAE